MDEQRKTQAGTLPASIALAAHAWTLEAAELSKTAGATDSDLAQCAELSSISAAAAQYAEIADGLGSGYEVHSAYFHGIADAYSVAADYCFKSLPTLP